MKKALPLGVWMTALALLLGGAQGAGSAVQQEETTPSRQEQVRKLIAVVRDPSLQETDPQRVNQAIQLLGAMRATEAIDDLAGLLTFRNWLPYEKDPTKPKSEDHLMTPGRRYPAISALVQIGPASLPALIKVITTHEPGSLESQNAIEAIIELSRYDRPAYLGKLNDAAAKASSKEASERLLEAAQTLKESKR